MYVVELTLFSKLMFSLLFSFVNILFFGVSNDFKIIFQKDTRNFYEKKQAKTKRNTATDFRENETRSTHMSQT